MVWIWQTLICHVVREYCNAFCLIKIFAIILTNHVWTSYIVVIEIMRGTFILTPYFRSQTHSITVRKSISIQLLLMLMHKFRSFSIISWEILRNYHLSGCLNNWLPFGSIWYHLFELLWSQGMFLVITRLHRWFHKVNFLEHTNIFINLLHQFILPVYKVERTINWRAWM